MLIPSLSFANNQWLIASKNEIINSGKNLLIHVVKPNYSSEWPSAISLNLAGSINNEQVLLTLVDSEQKETAVRLYQGVSNADFVGVIRVELDLKNSNRLLMLAKGNAYIAPIEKEQITVANNNQANNTVFDMPITTRVVIPSPEEDPTITANEPLYFLFGSNQQRSFDARFQISFKYRPFDPEATVAKFVPFASNLYFAYTQTSIWDLGGDSSPFEDTSYRPSLYYNWAESGNGYNPNSWKFGLEHESNGRDEEDSRSLNIAFVQPFWNIDFASGSKLTLMPRIYHYIEKEDNRDIHHFRGNADWMARYGKEDKGILTALYRQGTDGYAFGQLDFSYPVSDKLFGRTGSFLHLQLMGGYGETLLDYNRDSDTQLRIGLSLAR